MSRDIRKAWGVSLLFHILVLLLALFTQLPQIVRSSDFVEMQWGAIASAPARADEPLPVSTPVETAPPVTAPKPSKTQPVRKEAATPKRDVVLPQRSLPDMSDEMLNIAPRGDKLESTTGAGIPGLPQRTAQERTQDAVTTRTPGDVEGERAIPATAGTGVGVTGTGSGKVGAEVGYSVQWTGGGTRRRISGRLPAYPEGTNVRAQVQIRAVVEPDGSVSTVTPLQKANRNLEEAAMAELRLWKFEALRSNVPQVDQDCVVTFVFTLQ